MAERTEGLLARWRAGRGDPTAFLAAQFDLGLAMVDLPEGLGGLGIDAALQREVDRRLREAGAPSASSSNPLGFGMGIPTLRRHGSPDQLRRYLRRCYTGEEIWCQLFSEPGSGSDLAAAATRAVRDGEEWIVTGQKVWTSFAHIASVGMLLARTHPEQPKHRGLTYFLLDMRAPGVEVRPLRQMTGDAEFNEVFLTDVRIPDTDRVGEAGDGWSVAVTTLMNERILLSGAGAKVQHVRGTSVADLIATARRTHRWEDASVRDEVMRRYIESRVIRLTSQRARARRAGSGPGAEGSVTKLLQCIHNQRLQNTAMRIAGVGATTWEAGDDGAWATVRGFLRAQANTIEGGTSDIQRNVIGERILGLPKEPGPPADTPWRDLLRNQ